MCLFFPFQTCWISIHSSKHTAQAIRFSCWFPSAEWPRISYTCQLTSRPKLVWAMLLSTWLTQASLVCFVSLFSPNTLWRFKSISRCCACLLEGIWWLQQLEFAKSEGPSKNRLGDLVIVLRDESVSTLRNQCRQCCRPVGFQPRQQNPQVCYISWSGPHQGQWLKQKMGRLYSERTFSQFFRI